MAQILKRSFWIIVVSIAIYTIIIFITTQFIKFDKTWLLVLSSGLLFPLILVIVASFVKVDKDKFDSMLVMINSKADKEKTEKEIENINLRFAEHINNNLQQYVDLKADLKGDIKGVRDQLDQILTLLLNKKK